MDRWKASTTYRPDYQKADGGPQRSLEVSDTLLHGGLDSSRHVSCMVCMHHRGAEPSKGYGASTSTFPPVFRKEIQWIRIRVFKRLNIESAGSIFRFSWSKIMEPSPISIWDTAFRNDFNKTEVSSRFKRRIFFYREMQCCALLYMQHIVAIFPADRTVTTLNLWNTRFVMTRQKSTKPFFTAMWLNLLVDNHRHTNLRTNNVADPDPGSGDRVPFWPLAPGSGMGNNPDPGWGIFQIRDPGWTSRILFSRT